MITLSQIYCNVIANIRQLSAATKTNPLSADKLSQWNSQGTSSDLARQGNQQSHSNSVAQSVHKIHCEKGHYVAETGTVSERSHLLSCLALWLGTDQISTGGQFEGFFGNFFSLEQKLVLDQSVSKTPIQQNLAVFLPPFTAIIAINFLLSL